MENRKGSGVFLGVVSVATLVVAIIGATFAYFSASLSSNEDAVDITAYEFNATMSMERLYPGEAVANLIPMVPGTTIEGATEPNNTNMLYALNAAETKCVDSAGYQVCALYKLTFTNGGAQDINLAGTLKTMVNTASTSGRAGATPFSNLTYQDVSGTEGSFTLAGDPVTLATSTETGSNTIDIADITIPANTTADSPFVKYVLIYLNDNGDQSGEMGANFEGQVTYTSTTGNGQQLTGTFTVNGGSEEGA